MNVNVDSELMEIMGKMLLFRGVFNSLVSQNEEQRKTIESMREEMRILKKQMEKNVE